jgi:hypothetical protein
MTGTPAFTGNQAKARFKDKELTTLSAIPQSKKSRGPIPRLLPGSLARRSGAVHLKQKEVR